MINQIRNKAVLMLSKKSKFFLIVISCLVPALYFIAVFLFLQLYVPALGCFLTFALFLIIYHTPLQKHKFRTVFLGILFYAFIFELFAAYCLEWEMGFQNLLFALIPLCFSFLYMANNYDQIIPHGIRYSISVVLCYLLCSVIDFIVVPNSGATHFEIRVISGLSSILTIWMIFFYVVIFVKELYAAHRKLEEETNLRFDSLRSSMMLSQIKPHFIYNTMGAIEEMIDTDPANAQQAMACFARYMRTNIDSLSSSELIPFEKELSHIKAYVQIQNLRFGDTIGMEYDIECINFSLPPLTIQPIVENAVNHGIRPKGGRGTIKLSVKQDAGSYIIRITDDGVGMDMSKPEPKTTSTGLYNINYRIQKLCQGRMEMESAPGAGTTATVIIPRAEEKETVST